jgi:hypothetical protein
LFEGSPIQRDEPEFNDIGEEQDGDFDFFVIGFKATDITVDFINPHVDGGEGQVFSHEDGQFVEFGGGHRGWSGSEVRIPQERTVAVMGMRTGMRTMMLGQWGL